ncbi:damage-inducible protein DinB [Roseovarius sp. HI0049]|nr:damage-inducible protein DinB [Roseovarius sp. HI0049]
MITPDYCRLMARYNAWQNRQIEKALEGVPLEDLKADHGAYFGSILGTLNHLVWGDRMWMSRFDPACARPEGGIKKSTDLFPTLGAWSAERFRVDGMIARWAAEVHAVDLTGSFRFYSGAMGAEVTRQIAPCVVHMFNHQTHHRGQVHAMMTKTGLTAPVTDLFIMPDEE